MKMRNLENMETVPVDTERGHKGLEAGMVQGEVGEAAGLQQRTQETKRRDLDPPPRYRTV